MEYELKHYYRVKYALVCARQSFLKEPPKDDFEEVAGILGMIDEGMTGRLVDVNTPDTQVVITVEDYED